jgi:PAS domain S-box-containing protein
MNVEVLQRELAAARAQIEHQQAEHRAALKEQQDNRDAMLFMLEDLENARKKIEHSHQEWMASLDVVDDPIFLHDKQFRILRCNKAYQQRAGIPFHEIVGNPYYDIFPKTGSPLLSCLRGMENAETAADEEEMVFGGTIYRSRTYPVYDEQGVYLHSVHILEDITKQKHAEGLIKHQQKLIQDVIDGSKTLIYSLDNDGKFTLANKSLTTILKIDREQLLGKSRESVLPKEIAEEHRKNDLEVMSRDGVVEFEERNIQEDGTHFYLSQKFPLSDLEGNVYGVCGISTDITERKQSELAQQRSNRALRTLSAGNESLIYAIDENQLLHAICRTAVDTGGYRMAWVGFVENDAVQSIRPVAQAGFEEGYLERAIITWADNEHGQGPTGRAVRTCATQVAQDIALDPMISLWRTEAMKRGYASSIALPLLEQGSCFGVLSIYAAEADAFDDDEIKLLKEMASDLAFGILTLRIKEAHREHEQRLQKNMLQTVEAIAGIVEMRDPYTSGHQARVADVAEAIAHRMGLAEEQTQVIHLAGLVHDLGKIAIPAEILSKPGRLNDIEYSLIKMHPKAGFDVLKDIEFSWPIAQMVLQHHERLDGSGYPHGLKGDEILLGARILCVADVVEAMTSHRPYRPGLGIEAAMDEIKRGRGLDYDEQVVDACVSLFREQGYVLTA